MFLNGFVAQILQGTNDAAQLAERLADLVPQGVVVTENHALGHLHGFLQPSLAGTLRHLSAP